jgi:hypothetical protein
LDRLFQALPEKDFPMRLKLKTRLSLPGLAALIALPLLSIAAHADGAVSKLGWMAMGAKAGQMPQFDEVVARFNQSGERFRIDQHCQSACTMFLSIRNVCVTPGARLLFHAGGDRRRGVFSQSATDHMLSAYKPALQRYLIDGHYMETFTFHTISGRDIISRFGYPAC